MGGPPGRTPVSGRAADGRVLPHLAVNLTAADITDELVEAVRRSVIDAELPNGFLGLERSEQAFIPDDPEVIERMDRLRSFGVHLALDDFGTGFSSLANLKDLPLDTVKIDRRFITHIESDPADQAIVASTIEMAHRMGLRVVAEGVETVEQARHLLGCGCIWGRATSSRCRWHPRRWKPGSPAAKHRPPTPADRLDAGASQNPKPLRRERIRGSIPGRGRRPGRRGR